MEFSNLGNNQNNAQNNGSDQDSSTVKQELQHNLVSSPEPTPPQKKFSLKPKSWTTIIIFALICFLGVLLAIVFLSDDQTPEETPADDQDQSTKTEAKAPVLTIVQDGSTMTVESESKDLVEVDHFITAVEPECTSKTDSFVWQQSRVGKTVSQLANGDWVCFRGKNKNSLYGYVKQRVDLSSSDLEITQDRLSVEASSAKDLSGWQYFTSSTNPNCSEANLEAWQTAKAGRAIEEVNNNDTWICFRAKNKLGVYSYNEIQVILTAPTIKLIQNNDKVLAESDLKLTDWRYFTNSQEADCTDQSDQWDNSQKGQQTTTVEDGHWVCFRGKNSRGVWGFQSRRVDLTRPLLDFTINGFSVEASSSSEVDSWQYFQAQKEPSCDPDEGWELVKSGSVATNLNANDWVCFKAKNKLGVWGFGKYQYVALPTIAARQVNRSVIVQASSNVGQLEYVLVASSISNCSSPTIDWQNSTKSSLTGNLDNNDRVCFRGSQGQPNNYTYSVVVVVDLNPPKVLVDTSGLSLTADGYSGVIIASSDESLTGWEYFILSKNNQSAWKDRVSISANSDCQEVNFAWNQPELIEAGNRFNVDKDVVFACLRGKNSKGVYGYNHWLPATASTTE